MPCLIFEFSLQYYSHAARGENYPRNINVSDRLILIMKRINSMVWHPNRVFSLLCFVVFRLRGKMVSSVCSVALYTTNFQESHFVC